MFKKDRKRRIIYNDDSDQQFARLNRPPYNFIDEQSFIDARTTPTFGTQVDTYVWNVGNGATPPWGPWAELNDYIVHPFLGTHQYATDAIIKACHSNNMEIWGSLRMNDSHDAHVKQLEHTNDSFKSKHPEYLLGTIADRDLGNEHIESYQWAALNFEHQAVREHRLSYIKDNAATHDFDGYELDFTRFIWNFPQGKELELAPLMTEFIKDVRDVLDNIGKKRRRKYTFIVHVPDSIETSLMLGLDVEKWMSNQLVDIVVAGMGFNPYKMPIGNWKQLGLRYGIPIYTSLNTRPLFKLYRDTFRSSAAWIKYIRGVADWWWYCDVDGIYLFNLFTHCEFNTKPLDKEIVYKPLSEIGEISTLKKENKIYAIDSVVGMFTQASVASELPTILDKNERRILLNVGFDANDEDATFVLHVWLNQDGQDLRIWVRVNHVSVELMQDSNHWIATLPEGIFRTGENDFTMYCNIESVTNNPIIVTEVFVEAEF